MYKPAERPGESPEGVGRKKGVFVSTSATLQARLRPLNLHLRPFQVTPTTLKSPCRERAYDPQTSTYDPSSIPPFAAFPIHPNPAEVQ